MIDDGVVQLFDNPGYDVDLIALHAISLFTFIRNNSM